MLVLKRRLGERIIIGEEIVLTVVEVKGNFVRLGIQCPASIPVHREEVYQRIRAERLANGTATPNDESECYSEFI
jgi:carbon storage regulator